MELNTRYGLDALDVSNIRRRWCRSVRDDCEFECFDDFLLWCAENGYEKGIELRKRKEFEPHSPENSYFWSSKKAEEERQQIILQNQKEVSEFCKSCTKECTHSTGCKPWQDWFVKNWNQKISISPKVRGCVKVTKSWRYEHPDLIRERIV